MPINAIPEGTYRIRQAGAKSEIANLVSNGKKCHYVQIGIEITGFDSLESAQEFVADKDLVADKMSMDFGVEKAAPEEEVADASEEE